MSADTRTLTAVHVVTWMAFGRCRTGNEIAALQRIATSVSTIPVGVRRRLGELCDAGVVEPVRAEVMLTREANPSFVAWRFPVPRMSADPRVTSEGGDGAAAGAWAAVSVLPRRV